MSGASGMRGYLLQTLIALLEGLTGNSLWEEVCLEPNISSEKVDIQWIYKSKNRVVQVKSSQNQINKSHAISWAKELKNSITADSYELLLIGPTSQAVIELKNVDGVEIPTPKNLDITGLVEQIAHRLDRYLENRNISKVPSFVRELIVNALITRLETYSTNGTRVTRNDFDKLLSDWIFASYPNSVNEAVSMQSDILCDTVVLAVSSPPSHKSFALILPLIFINGGTRTAIINWVAIKVEGKNNTKLYTPVAFIDWKKFIQGKRKLHADNTLSQFSEFALQKDIACEKNILFTQEKNNSAYPFQTWTTGVYSFRVYVKYADKDIPLLKKELEMNITEKTISDYQNGRTIVESSRNIQL